MTTQIIMYTLDETPIASYTFASKEMPVPTDAPSWLVLAHIAAGSKPGLELYEHGEGCDFARRCKLLPEMLPGLKKILDCFLIANDK